MTVLDLRHHKADYGYDGDYRAVSAPTVATIVGTVSAGLLASAARSLVRGKPVAAAVTGGTGASIVTTAALFIRTTRVGKFEVWAEILEELRLRGDETLLDLGCGRGAVLLAAAKLLSNGRAIGVDIWRADKLTTRSRTRCATPSSRASPIASRCAPPTSPICRSTTTAST